MRQLRWAQRNQRKILIISAVTGASGVYYISHLERTPITGRIRFINIGKEAEQALSVNSANQVLQAYSGRILSPYSSIVIKIRGVVEKLSKEIREFVPDADTNFKLYVIDSEEANAFVLPGGQIFVFTGLLPIAKTQEGLATVLAHEIAHSVVRHGAEKLSFYEFFSLLFGVVQFVATGDIHNPVGNFMKTLLLDLPFSRKCETEADYIGLMLMAKACFDPSEAVGLWQRMDKFKSSNPLETFFSTHPTHKNRISNIKTWLPSAEKIFDDSGCQRLHRSFLDRINSETKFY